MAIVPSSTRFVGFAPGANMQERKSAMINVLAEPYTMADIASASPQIEILLDNGVISSTDLLASVKSKYASFESAYFWNISMEVNADGINIPNESYFDFVSIYNNSADFENLSIPNLIQATGTIDCRNNANLTTVNIGQIGTVKQLNNVYLPGNNLNVETVNYILALLVSLDGTNGTLLWDSGVELYEGTNAAPTGQGLIDKQILIDRGADVLTN